MAAPNVFVSHSHKDDDFTVRLVADLRQAGAERPRWSLLDRSMPGIMRFAQTAAEAQSWTGCAV